MYSTYILGRLNSRREAEKKRLERIENQKEELKKVDKTNSAAEKEDALTVLHVAFKKYPLLAILGLIRTGILIFIRL